MPDNGTRAETIEFRYLSGDEAQEFAPRLAALGYGIPYPNGAVIVLAMAAEKIAGFCVLQMLPHCEPLWVDPQMRASGLAEALADHAVTWLKAKGFPHFLACASNAFAEKLCQGQGMTAVEGRLYAAKPN